MKVLVCGGRSYSDVDTVHEVLNILHEKEAPITMIIEGGASGADALGGGWADERGIARATVKANWNCHGKDAGPIRNKAMLSLNPDIVVAFPGGTGTANMIKLAAAAGTKMVIVDPDGGSRWG